MSNQENFTVTREALAAVSGRHYPRSPRHDVVFRRYLAAIAYQDIHPVDPADDAVEKNQQPPQDAAFVEQEVQWDLRAVSVGEIMTTDVVSVTDTASFREIVDALTGHRISAVPVVDADRRVIGIVSESDLLAKVVTGGDPQARIKGAWRSAPRLRRKSQADTAAALMSSPAVTTTPDASVVEAARKAAIEFVRRMPVVDDAGVLVGIVTRSDLLCVFDRSDDDLRAHILDDIVRQDLCMNPLTIGVIVEQGIVTLSGELEKQTLVPLLVEAVRSTRGVVNVDNKLSYRIADEATFPIGPIY